MTFDPTLTIGVILHLVILVVVLTRFATRLDAKIQHTYDQLDKCIHRLHSENVSRITVIEQKVGDLWAWFIHRNHPRNHTEDK